MTDAAFKRYQERQRVWREYKHLHCQAEASGESLSISAAAGAIGVPVATLWRIVKAVEEAGEDNGLKPNFSNSGRTNKWDHLLQIEEFAGKLDALYLATLGASSEAAAAGRRTAKAKTACMAMAEETICPPKLALELRRGKIPASFRRHLGRITPEVEAKLRGPKHYQHAGLVSRRDHTVKLPDGKRAILKAGCLWEFDDMSLNHPFFAVHHSGGWTISRQGLYGRDVVSRRWLGAELIARPREAYRADDVLRFFRRLFEHYDGKPDIIRLEKGVWASRKIRGVRLTEAGLEEEEFQRPGMPEADQAMLHDGLEAIGIKLHYVHSSHGKGGIESAFNHLQDWTGIKLQDYVCVGRHAGEFERSAKRLRQTRYKSGAFHPEGLGFAPIDVAMDRVDEAFRVINGKPNSVDNRIPDNVWQEDIAARPLMRMEDRDLAALLPDMREATIRGGRIELKVGLGAPKIFRHELFAELGTGFRVTVKLDPTELHLGVAVYSREIAGAANHKGYQPGQFICLAPFEAPGAQICMDEAPRGLEVVEFQELYPGAEDDGHARRKAQDQIVRSAYRALPKPGQPSVKVSEARNGAGRLDRVESGAGGKKLGAKPAKKPFADRAKQRSRFRDRAAARTQTPDPVTTDG